MIARRESRVAARTDSADAVGAARSATLAPTLASTAGQRPSIAESQSGRAAGTPALVQARFPAAALTSSVRSCSEEKKARQEASTEFGSTAHLA